MWVVCIQTPVFVLVQQVLYPQIHLSSLRVLKLPFAFLSLPVQPYIDSNMNKTDAPGALVVEMKGVGEEKTLA